jgi:phosphate:Na+ symporter
MYADIFTFAGGIGLFLLGMRLMTDGLKVAAGDALRSILASATRSPQRGIASGLLITTAVQSSSAVIFATIGFVNAGLLTLHQSIGIVYGANLGTTLTSWVVAVVGFNVNLRALALPAIGIGMALWVTAGTSRRGALGQAIAGFGLFFLGIDVLRDGFEGLGGRMSPEAWIEHGVLGLAAFVVSGALLTVLMQSSSAALAVTLTAAASGLVPVQAAAAMIIGANVGTTSTAVFASIGATSPAKRVAAAHVLFNVVTAIAAMILMPVLLWLAQGINSLLAATPQAAITLALFHTSTKLLGIGLMWPLTSRFVPLLEKRFRSAEEDETRPQYLDNNVLTTPALAIDALGLELQRTGDIAHRLCGDALSGENSNPERLSRGHAALENLQEVIGEFTSSIHRHQQDAELVATLPSVMRVVQYHVNMGELAQELARLQTEAHTEHAELTMLLMRQRANAEAVLNATRVDTEHWNRSAAEAALAHFETAYQSTKTRLLRAGTAGDISPRRMAALLEHGSILRRVCEQATKAALHLDQFLDLHRPIALPEPHEDDAEPAAGSASTPQEETR